MEIRSYNAELAYANLMFSRLFRNIVLERTSNGKTTQFTVDCMFGQRSRVLKNFQNPTKKAMYKLPMIVINRTGIQRNSQRLNNLHNEIKYQQSSSHINYNLFTPVPIDISYEVTIVSKFPGDIDKILSNFICFFNNDLFVSSVHPKYSGLVLNNQVVMQDTINEQLPDELAPEQDDIQTATVSFIFKTYIFSGPDKADSDGVHVVQKLSTQLSTWTEISVDADGNPVIGPDGNPISTVISAEVPISIDTIYDGFIPQILTISAGFYPVPYVSCMLDEDGKQVLCANYDVISYINSVDNYPNPNPFVDRLIWRIDNASDAAFPENVGQYNGNVYPDGQ